MDTDPLPLDQLLHNRYRIVALVGQGNTATVYKAEDTELGNRLLAIKEIRPDGLNPKHWAEATGQFWNETVLLAGLTHPNLPQLYAQLQEAGRHYLVMEYAAISSPIPAILAG